MVLGKLKKLFSSKNVVADNNTKAPQTSKARGKGKGKEPESDPAVTIEPTPEALLEIVLRDEVAAERLERLSWDSDSDGEHIPHDAYLDMKAALNRDVNVSGSNWGPSELSDHSPRSGCDSDSDGNSSDEDEEYVGDLAFEEGSSKQFESLSPDAILRVQQEEVNSVAELLSIHPSAAAALLRHFDWKREKMLAKYFENSQQTCTEAGVDPATLRALRASGGEGSAAAAAAAASGQSDGMCTICADDITAANSIGLSCGHFFCLDCWGTYLVTKINGGECQIKCPAHKCPVRVEDDLIKRLVPPVSFEKYISFVTSKFVQGNDLVRWCPTPGCGNAVAVSAAADAVNYVQCSCGFKFCFACHREAHSPATCEQMQQWEQKCQDDSETSNWKTVNTKECSRCRTPIEKNGGCNHMTCRQCKYEWCWVCMRTWKGHNDFYNCNRFEKDKEKELKRLLSKAGSGSKKDRRRALEEERERHRLALERYLHYYERFMNHEMSRKLERQVRDKARERMMELQLHHHATLADVQFIAKGIDELLDCRSVLKYTYVFAYYFLAEERKPIGNSKQLFEYLQEDLEKTTEKLSEVMEDVMHRTPVDSAHRLEAINFSTLARTKKDNLLNAVAKDPLFEAS